MLLLQPMPTGSYSNLVPLVPQLGRHCAKATEAVHNGLVYCTECHCMCHLKSCLCYHGTNGAYIGHCNYFGCSWFKNVASNVIL